MNRNSDQVSRANHRGAVTQILGCCIVLGTVLYMAFAAMNTLSFLVSANDPEQSIFSLQAAGGKAGNFGANRPELILKAVILDGRLLRWDSVASKSNWQLIDRGGLPPFLLYSDGFKPAFLTFQGVHMLAVFQASNWAGAFRVERNGREIQPLILRDPAGQQGLIVLESPATPPSIAIFVAALMLFATCAYLFGPIRVNRSSLPWLIFFLSLLHLLFWTTQCVGTTNDSPEYVETSARFVTEGVPSFFPPGYPVFLGLVDCFSSKDLGRWVTLIQHAMVVLASVWIYLLLRKIVPQGLALLGGILAGGLAPSLTAPQAIMSETPTLFAMVGALYFTVRFAETARLHYLVLAGVLAGWAGTLRIVPLAALLPAICLIYLLPPTKRGLKPAFITLAITVGVVALPVFWCWYKSGIPGLTNSLGPHLFNRVVTEQKQLDEDGPATRTLIELLEGKDPRGVPHWEIGDYGRFSKLDDLQQKRLFLEVSLEAIRKYPITIAAYSPRLAWKVLTADPSYWIPEWGATILFHPSLENQPPLLFSASSLAWRFGLEDVHRFLWPILCWIGVAGTLVGLFCPQRKLVLALAWLPTGYLLSSACVEYFNPRYNAAIIPFIAALGMISMASILRLLNPTVRMLISRGRELTEFKSTVD